MTHILKLLSGDRGNPTSELDLNQLTAGEIRLTSGGLVPNPGQLNVLYTGESIRYNGELPVKESRSNMRLELRYNIAGGSSADISRIQREITQFLRDAKLYNQDGHGEAVWLEYRWNTSQALDDLPRPTWGQLNYYAEILSADDRWPDNVHEQGYLSSNFVEGVIATLTCKPHWYGLEQRCVTTPGLMDVTDQTNTTLSAGIDFSGTFVISGWFENTDSLAANNAFIKYYIDANNFFEVYQATNGTVQLRYYFGAALTNLSKAGNTSAANHVVIIQRSSTTALYVNGVAATGTLTSRAWSGGSLYVGCFQTSSGTETTSTLDGLRFWEGETLTAAQVAALYAEEKAIKDAGGRVGKPPYQYTYNATNLIYRGNSTNSGGYNTMVIGNVNGSGVEALTRIDVSDATYTESPAYAQEKVYIGRYATTGSVLIAGYGWRDLGSGGSSTANNDSVGNAYRSDSWSAAANDSTEFVSTTSSGINGKLLILARVLSNGDDCTAKVGWRYGINNDTIYTDAVSISDSTNWQLIEFGEIYIRMPKQPSYADGVFKGMYLNMIQNAGSGAVTIGADFIQMLPWPYVIIDGSNNAFDAMNFTLYKSLASYSNQELFEVIGAPEGITLEPRKYNHVSFQFTPASISSSVDIDSEHLTVTTYVTPRWLLPGGLVA